MVQQSSLLLFCSLLRLHLALDFAFERQVLALGNDGDLSALEQTLVEDFCTDGGLLFSKFNVAVARGPLGELVFNNGHSDDLSTLFEVLLDLVLRCRVVHVLHKD